MRNNKISSNYQNIEESLEPLEDYMHDLLVIFHHLCKQKFFEQKKNVSTINWRSFCCIDVVNIIKTEFDWLFPKSKIVIFVCCVRILMESFNIRIGHLGE